MKNQFEGMNDWYRKGKTYKAKTLSALKTLYSSGVHAKLEEKECQDDSETKQSDKGSTNGI